jgi:hypothetical protein
MRIYRLQLSYEATSPSKESYMTPMPLQENPFSELCGIKEDLDVVADRIMAGILTSVFTDDLVLLIGSQLRLVIDSLERVMPELRPLFPSAFEEWSPIPVSVDLLKARLALTETERTRRGYMALLRALVTGSDLQLFWQLDAKVEAVVRSYGVPVAPLLESFQCKFDMAANGYA